MDLYNRMKDSGNPWATGLRDKALILKDLMLQPYSLDATYQTWLPMIVVSLPILDGFLVQGLGCPHLSVRLQAMLG